ncbi:MAG: MFS transporter, partial [Byssovorax sp.]
FGIILPVLPYFAEKLGASSAVVALLASAFSLAQLAMAPVLGRLSDRFGRRPVLLISIAGSVVSSALLGIAGSVAMVFASRAMAGMSKANLATANAYAADLVVPGQRARIMGRLGAAASLGLVVGPAIGGLLAVERLPTLPFFIAAGLSVLNFVLVWYWVPEPQRAASAVDLGAAARADDAPAKAAHAGPERANALVWIVAVNTLFFVGYSSVQSTFALFTKQVFGWGSLETGRTLMLMGATMVLAQGLVVGRAVARLGEMGAAILGLTTFLGGAVILCWSAAAGNMIALLAGSMVLVTGVGLLQTSLTVLVSCLSPGSGKGLGLGIRESSSAGGRILGPVIGGLAFQLKGVTWPSIVGGVGAACGLAILLALGGQRRSFIQAGVTRRRSKVA